MDIYKLPENQFKIIILKSSVSYKRTQIGRQLNKNQGNYAWKKWELFENKDIEAIKNEILELKNTMTELQNSTESFNTRPGEAEERIKNLKDRS